MDTLAALIPLMTHSAIMQVNSRKELWHFRNKHKINLTQYSAQQKPDQYEEATLNITRQQFKMSDSCNRSAPQQISSNLTTKRPQQHVLDT